MTELCYYETTVRRPSYPRLEGEVRTDVCVIGGGLAGCSTAMHLAKLGYEVVLLEAKHIGFGASGRNGGQVMPGFGCELEYLDKKVGEEQAKKLFELSIGAVAHVKSLIETHKINADWRDGLAFLAINKSQLGDIAKKHRDLRHRFGYRTRWLDAPQARSAIGSRRYVGGMVDELSGHMNPLKFTLALAALAEQSSRVQIFESSPVTSLDDGFPGVVRTALGTVHAKHVVLCSNAYVGDLDSDVERRIVPMRTYVIATEPISNAVSPAVLSLGAAVGDRNNILDYFRLTADRRLLFGGRVSVFDRDPAQMGERMIRRVVRIFPQLSGIRVDYAWHGLLDFTLNRGIDAGVRNNRYYVQGFSGHGVAMATYAGKIIGDAIAGERAELDLLARLEHRGFPRVSWLRACARACGIIGFSCLDLLSELKAKFDR